MLGSCQPSLLTLYRSSTTFLPCPFSFLSCLHPCCWFFPQTRHVQLLLPLDMWPSTGTQLSYLGSHSGICQLPVPSQLDVGHPAHLLAMYVACGVHCWVRPLMTFLSVYTTPDGTVEASQHGWNFQVNSRLIDSGLATQVCDIFRPYHLVGVATWIRAIAYIVLRPSGASLSGRCEGRHNGVFT